MRSFNQIRPFRFDDDDGIAFDGQQRASISFLRVFSLQDGDEVRPAGSEWLFEGPGTYIPKVEVSVEETIRASVIKPNQVQAKPDLYQLLQQCASVCSCSSFHNWFVVCWVFVFLNRVILFHAYSHFLTHAHSRLLSLLQALRVRARKETSDRDGNKRVTGEEWLVVRVGAYLPGAYEEVLDTVNAIVLTDKVALHMRAIRTFTDTFSKLRRTGKF